MPLKGLASLVEDSRPPPGSLFCALWLTRWDGTD